MSAYRPIYHTSYRSNGCTNSTAVVPHQASNKPDECDLDSQMVHWAPNTGMNHIDFSRRIQYLVLIETCRLIGMGDPPAGAVGVSIAPLGLVVPTISAVGDQEVSRLTGNRCTHEGVIVVKPVRSSFLIRLCVPGLAFALVWVGPAPTLAQTDITLPEAVGELQDRFPGLGVHLEQDGTLAFFGKPMTAAATAAGAAQAWLQDHAAAFGAGNPDLRIERISVVGHSPRTVFVYRQFLDGLRVEYGTARLLVLNELSSRVVFAAARLARPPKGGFPLDRVGAPDALKNVQAVEAYAHLTEWSVPEMVIFQDQSDNARPRAIRAWKFLGIGPDRSDFEAYTFFVDAADGSLAHVRNEVYKGDGDVVGRVSGLSSPGTLPDLPPNDPVSFDMADLQLMSEFGLTALTDGNGEYVMQNDGAGPVTIEAEFKGLWVEVRDTAGPLLSSLFQSVVPPGPADFIFNTSPSEFTTAQVNAFIHTTAAHNFFKDRQPGFSEIDTALICHVNQFADCNAFFTPIGPSLNFFTAGAGCVNTAYSTVVGHEYAHFVVHALGLRQGAFGEGFGDCVALLLYDDPIVGRDFFGQGTFVRDIVQADKTYPCFGEIHDCGQVLAGVWWDIKLEMQTSLGQDRGLETTRQLFTDWSQITLGGRLQDSAHPLTAAEVLVADDDDGDLGNGTLHLDEICAGFVAHHIPCPGTCDQVRRLRVSCRSSLFGLNSFVIQATISTDDPGGSTVTLVLDDSDGRTIAVSRRGRGTTRWRDVAEGNHDVCIEGCDGLCRRVTCER